MNINEFNEIQIKIRKNNTDLKQYNINKCKETIKLNYYKLRRKYKLKEAF